MMEALLCSTIVVGATLVAQPSFIFGQVPRWVIFEFVATPRKKIGKEDASNFSQSNRKLGKEKKRIRLEGTASAYLGITSRYTLGDRGMISFLSSQ